MAVLFVVQELPDSGQKFQKFLRGLGHGKCGVDRRDHLSGRQILLCFYDK